MVTTMCLKGFLSAREKRLAPLCSPSRKMPLPSGPVAFIPRLDRSRSRRGTSLAPGRSETYGSQERWGFPPWLFVGQVPLGHLRPVRHLEARQKPSENHRQGVEVGPWCAALLSGHYPAAARKSIPPGRTKPTSPPICQRSAIRGFQSLDSGRRKRLPHLRGAGRHHRRGRRATGHAANGPLSSRP